MKIAAASRHILQYFCLDTIRPNPVSTIHDSRFTIHHSPFTTHHLIRLEKFDSSDYADLISWIKDEEMLMKFGGPSFSFPLTAEQLDKSQEDKQRYSFKVVDVERNKTIGHCEVYLLEETAKLARILIGEDTQRGKGLGKEIMKALIDFTANQLHRTNIELNVFDWNVGAIKCYESVGFKINPNKRLERKVNGKTWIAVNMVLQIPNS